MTEGPPNAEVLYRMAPKVNITTAPAQTECIVPPRFPCVTRFREVVKARVVEQPNGCLCNQCKMKTICKRGW